MRNTYINILGDRKRITPQQYKGYTLNYFGGEWQARAYANPEFNNSNLQKIKKEINKYLKS